MNLKNAFKICFVVVIVLFGCEQNKTAEQNLQNGTNAAIQLVESEMPHDFNFKLQFGVGKNNEINTFEQTFTKDLIADGTATTKFVLSVTEMKDIYKKMQAVNIVETKEFTPKSTKGACMVEPHEEDEWKITMNGETILHNISLTYCEPTKDTKQFLQLRNDILAIIKAKPEYQALPKANGAYE